MEGVLLLEKQGALVHNDADMANDSENVVVAIFRRFWPILSEKEIGLPGISTRQMDRWLKGDNPSGDGARNVAHSVWDRIHLEGAEEMREAVLACIRGVVPTAPRKWDKTRFGAWFFDQAEAVRATIPRKPRKKRESAKINRPPAERGALSSETKFDPANPVHVRVNQLFSDAGFPVFQGVVSCGTAIQVHLGPLYAYVERLQSSAEVPNPFVAGRTIHLDALFVELTAAEDQRGQIWPDGGRPSTVAAADRPSADPVGLWREATHRHRISLEALVSRTELLPAVLFGDPGSGKSTLTQFALHALGRGLVSGKGLSIGDAIPFRLALREFAREGKPDDYAIIAHLLRRVLRVPPESFEDWRTLLTHFFYDEKPHRLFLLIDGVDEITPNDKVFGAIQRRLEEVTSVARLLITSRRAGFQAPVLRFAPFELVELSELAMHGLIGNWFRQVSPRSAEFAENFARWIFGDPRRQEMGANPCLLSLLCFLNQDRPENHFIQAVNRAELYGLAVEKLTSDYDRLGSVSLPEAVDALAAFALDRYLNLSQGQAPQVLFDREEVRRFFHRCRSGQLAPTATPPTGALNQDPSAVWLRTRLVSRWDIDRWLHFIHLSFQEYFAAVWLSNLPLAAVQTLMAQNRYNPFWREVWRFYAGLCRHHGTEREERFLALAQSFVQPCDLYEQSLFWLAPLCTEYGLNDTRSKLGFDLRDKLYQLFVRRHGQSLADMRRMVELDPEYFLDMARQVLDQQLLAYQDTRPRRRKPKLPETGDVSLSRDILEHIYHPNALRYQHNLIETEVHWSGLTAEHPSLGPQIPSGRNYALSKALEDWLESAAGPEQRERLVSYLSCGRGPRAGQAILAAARRERRMKPAAGAKAPAEPLKFQVHCLLALTGLQDVLAVELAAELWPEAEFRTQHLVEVCTQLRQIKHSAVPDLLERWLDQGQGDPDLDAVAFEAILGVLKEWPERKLPSCLEALLSDHAAAPSVRAAAWEVVVNCGGHEGRKRLQNRLAQWAALPRLTEGQAQEMARICEFVGAMKLPFLSELEDCAPKQSGTESPILLT